jgi:hypothetical protein
MQRAAEPHGRRGVRAVEQAFPARFGGVDAAFVVQHRVAVEAGRDAAFFARVGQQVAGELQLAEAIERHVAVERVDDPVAILPHRARRVEVEAVGVGVAREVEPRRGPAFAVVRRREQAVDGAFVRVGRAVGEEGVELCERRRQADQVERQAPQQRRAIGLGGRREAGALRTRGRERIDRRDVGSWRCRPHRGAVGPMMRRACSGLLRREDRQQEQQRPHAGRNTGAAHSHGNRGIGLAARRPAQRPGEVVRNRVADGWSTS